MKMKKWIFFVAPPALVLLIAIFGEVVMHLWNWLLPMLFGLRQITFWQGLGLLVLCRILFGGFGSHGSDGSHRRWRKGEQWERMTPEERRLRSANRRSQRASLMAPASVPLPEQRQSSSGRSGSWGLSHVQSSTRPRRMPMVTASVRLNRAGGS